MPRRSNEFQLLVTLLESQLAPTGASVQESALLPDTISGQLREIDILVSVPVGQRTMRIGIECRDHSRKADLPWIEQLQGKFATLPLDRRVAVSRRGFSKAAEARARIWSIETLALSSAVKRDWPSALAGIVGCEFVGTRFQIDQFALTIDSPYDNVNALSTKRLQPGVRLPDGRVLDLMTLVKLILHRPEGIRAVSTLQGKMSVEGPVGCEVLLPEGFVLSDQDGGEWQLARIDAVLTPLRTRLRARLQHASYGDAAVAIGRGEVEGVPFSLVLSESEAGAIRAHAAIGRAASVVINLSEALASDLKERSRFTIAGNVASVSLPLNEL